MEFNLETFFFNIPKDKNIKQKYYLPAIINNVVFRLEYHEKNLATRVLSKFRKVISKLWEEIYEVPVIGFETFVIETETRKGSLYKADNWTFIGYTKGSTKKHSGLKNAHVRKEVETKMIYCKWINNKPIVPTVEYKSSWKCETEFEKARKKRIEKLKKDLIGKLF